MLHIAIVCNDVDASQPVAEESANGGVRAETTDGRQDLALTAEGCSAQAAGDAADAGRALASWESEGGKTILRSFAAGETEE